MPGKNQKQKRLPGVHLAEMPSGSFHIALDTDHGTTTLCGQVEALAVYPGELVDYPPAMICAACRRLLEQSLTRAA